MSERDSGNHDVAAAHDRGSAARIEATAAPLADPALAGPDVDLKLDLTGAIVQVLKDVEGTKSVTALLLGRGGLHEEHMPPHRPILSFDADDVDDVQGLPVQTVLARKHKLLMTMDLSGTDLGLGATGTGGVVFDGPSSTLHPSRVVDLHSMQVENRPFVLKSGLLSAPAPSDTKLVVGRIFVESGAMSAATPIDPRHRPTTWKFDYKNAQGTTITHLLSLATDRLVLRVLVPGGLLKFLPHVPDGKDRVVKLRGGKEGKVRTVRAYLACGPCLTREEATGKHYSFVGNHYDMAYDIVVDPPSLRPTPSPKNPYRYPGKNCFKGTQFRME